MEERIFMGSYSTIVFADNLAVASLNIFSAPYLFLSTITHVRLFLYFPIHL